MLKNLHPLLTAELLYALRAMGHGDELVLADCNFPAASVAAHTVTGELITLAGADIPQAAEAILSVFPLDSFVEFPVYRMEVVGQPDELVECHTDMRRVIDETSGAHWKLGSIERFAFYERARKAYVVVCAAGERRPYGCFVLVKGVIDPHGNVV
jgi:L-fucose mutarotase